MPASERAPSRVRASRRLAVFKTADLSVSKAVIDERENFAGNSHVGFGAPTTLSDGSHAITLGQVTGAHALSVLTGLGNITLSGVTSSGLTLSGGAETLNAGTYSVGSPLTLGAVTTGGTLILGQATTFGATTLNADTVLNSSVAGTLVTLGQVTGSHSLTVSTGGAGVTLSGVTSTGLTLNTTGTETLNGPRMRLSASTI